MLSFSSFSFWNKLINIEKLSNFLFAKHNQKNFLNLTWILSIIFKIWKQWTHEHFFCSEWMEKFNFSIFTWLQHLMAIYTLAYIFDQTLQYGISTSIITFPTNYYNYNYFSNLQYINHHHLNKQVQSLLVHQSMTINNISLIITSNMHCFNNQLQSLFFRQKLITIQNIISFLWQLQSNFY